MGDKEERPVVLGFPFSVGEDQAEPSHERAAVGQARDTNMPATRIAPYGSSPITSDLIAAGTIRLMEPARRCRVYG